MREAEKEVKVATVVEKVGGEGQVVAREAGRWEQGGVVAGGWEVGSTVAMALEERGSSKEREHSTVMLTAMEEVRSLEGWGCFQGRRGQAEIQGPREGLTGDLAPRKACSLGSREAGEWGAAVMGG